MKLATTLTVLTLWSRTYAAAATDIESLPWSSLDVGGAFIDTNPQTYLDECYPDFQKFPTSERNYYDQIAQPSGLCTFNLFCAFQQCLPEAAYLNGEMTGAEVYGITSPYNEDPDQPLDEYDPTLKLSRQLEAWLDPSNPTFNIPAKVLFPTSARDIAAVVKFADTHGLKISVKNSGASLVGSSTKANSILINMRDYPRYASDENDEMYGIVECNQDVEKSNPIDMDQELCRLIRAKGKVAAMKVGGGENFDKVLRSLNAFNKRENFKYHMVTGAVGIVSPMGWTFQGGLSGTTRGREFGFGVDQVLQIEAVLPSGEHVRFGPTSWEDSPGFLVPRTTKVSGTCNTNLDGDEAIWGECPEDVDVLFDDLWHACRGGGGGTWGVVLSMHLQLHDYAKMQIVQPTPECGEFLLEELFEVLDDARDVNSGLGLLVAEFFVDYFLDPDALNITREQSNACAFSYAPQHTSICWGNEPMGDFFLAKYQDFVDNRIEQLSEEAKVHARTCLVSSPPVNGIDKMLNEDGKIAVAPNPVYTSEVAWSGNYLVPADWILANKKEFAATFQARYKPVYWAFGGQQADSSHDQTTSLSNGHRQAGAMVNLGLEPTSDSVSEWKALFTRMYDYSPGKIPAYHGHNHMAPTTYGPLKNSPTFEPCPTGDLTKAEAEEMCHSAQEMIFGTDGLKRLEEIKKAVDPKGTFDCFRCVGNSVSNEDPTTKSPKKNNKQGKVGKKSKAKKSKKS